MCGVIGEEIEMMLNWVRMEIRVEVLMVVRCVLTVGRLRFFHIALVGQWRAWWSLSHNGGHSGLQRVAVQACYEGFRQAAMM